MQETGVYVQCCRTDGVSEIERPLCDGDVTYDEAVALCDDDEWRLCALEELGNAPQTNLCDDDVRRTHPVWTSTRCDSPVEMEVTACSGWTYSPIPNAMKVRLKGTEGTTPFIVVDKTKALPSDSGTSNFSLFLDGMEKIEIGDFVGISVTIEDSMGWCAQSMRLSMDQNVTFENEFKSADESEDESVDGDSSNFTDSITTAIERVTFSFGSKYFGHGIIIARDCSYSFREIDPDLPMLPCFEDSLDLQMYAPSMCIFRFCSLYFVYFAYSEEQSEAFTLCPCIPAIGKRAG